MKGNGNIASVDCEKKYPDAVEWGASVVLPLVYSAPFKFSSTADLARYQKSDKAGFRTEYGRISNPTVRTVEMSLAALEGAEDAALFSSGMAAITTAMLCFLSAGDHVVITSDCYRRTLDFVTETLGKFGVHFDIVPVEAEKVEEAIRKETRLIFSESPTNPYLNVMDLEKLAGLSKYHGVLSIVDATFATPINVKPLSFGIDLVVHSCTKYLGGHNDLIAGTVAGRRELLDTIMDFRATMGGICSPDSAYKLDRGLKTLNLRVEQQNRSATAIAEYLESHSGVQRVFYPGLDSHPQSEISRKQMSGYGGVLSFLLDGDFNKTARFIDSLNIFLIAPSLGGVESLAEQPALMAYWDLTRAERERLGMHDNLVRLAVGVEDFRELISDISAALETV